jgi:hypothetical protein
MKKFVSALIQRPGANIIRAQSSPTILFLRSKSVTGSSSEATRSRPQPASPQPKPFFSRWLDAWRSRNGGTSR